MGEYGDSGSMVVGISNGRLHQNGNDKYNFHRQPTITTINDVIHGKSTTNSDAIYEVFTQGVSATNSHK